MKLLMTTVIETHIGEVELSLRSADFGMVTYHAGYRCPGGEVLGCHIRVPVESPLTYGEIKKTILQELSRKLLDEV